MPATPTHRPWPSDFRFCVVGTALILTVGVNSVCLGQLPSIDEKRLGVELVQTQGKRLYGFVLPANEPGILRFAVESNWLKRTYPAYHSELVEAEKRTQEQIQQLRIKRIEDWLDDQSESKPMQRFLGRSLRDAQTPVVENTPASPRFFVLEVKSTDINKLFRQPLQRKKIAGLAWQFGLEKVVISPVAVLQKRLEEQGVDIEKTQVDLGQGLPKFKTETDRQWLVRKALVEFYILGRLEFQGTGSKLFRGDEEPNMAQLMQAMSPLSGGGSLGQLGAELGLPEFKQFAKSEDKKDWYKVATDAADKEGKRGVQIMRLNQNLLSPDVRVQLHFFAKDDQGKWFEGIRLEVTEKTAGQSQQDLQELKNDPRIKQVISLVEGLGIGAGNLDQALAHGAATRIALEKARTQFEQLIDRHATDLSSLPIDVLPAR